MPKVQDTAKLHPKTVSEHQKHKKTKPRKSSKRQKVERLKVDSRVWEVATLLSEGDPTRLQILSETEVVVKNSRK